MKIRVAARDAECADQLVRQLVGIADAAARVDGRWAEVAVKPGPHSDRVIGSVLHAVEHWLDEYDLPSTTIQLGDRSHVIARSAAVREAVV